jgi:hypothetical protein
MITKKKKKKKKEEDNTQCISLTMTFGKAQA